MCGLWAWARAGDLVCPCGVPTSKRLRDGIRGQHKPPASGSTPNLLRSRPAAGPSRRCALPTQVFAYQFYSSRGAEWAAEAEEAHQQAAEGWSDNLDFMASAQVGAVRG